jgi:cytochrome c553
MKASFLLIGLLSQASLLPPPGPEKRRHRRQGLQMERPGGEKVEALTKKGDKKRGEEGYETCGACHLPSGAGRPDGTFPQLAGQHTTVLIKQMADIRAGLRDNPTMYPFAATLTDAAGTGRRRRLHRKPVHPPSTASTTRSRATIPTRTGRPRPTPTSDRRRQGAVREGMPGMPRQERRRQQGKFYPVIAGQHYKYLLRQMTEIRDGHRRNANPDMVKIIKPYT